METWEGPPPDERKPFSSRTYTTFLMGFDRCFGIFFPFTLRPCTKYSGIKDIWSRAWLPFVARSI